MKFTLFVLCIALAALITPGKAIANIDCFACTGAECEDPYKGPEEHVVQDCDYCIKIISKGNPDVTTRACGTGDPGFLACHGGYVSIVCHCDTDRCNSGSTTYLALSALLSALALQYIV